MANPFVNFLGFLRDPQTPNSLLQNAREVGSGLARGGSAGLLGGPVDLANMMLLNAGGDEPVGGSRWFERKMIEAGLMQPRYGTTPETVGELASMVFNPATAASAVPAVVGNALRGSRVVAGSPRAQIGAINPEGTFEEVLARNGIPVKPVPRAALKQILSSEPDMARSLGSSPEFKKGVPQDTLWDAISNRQRLRTEEPVTPGPNASEAEWAEWGAKHGVNMARTPSQSLGISDTLNRKEITVPGGLEGTFTIPDLFAIKANNFDPNALPKDLHDQLMLKFLRTYKLENPDAVDAFNRLAFAQLSPNAPLTANEFLAQRLRASNVNELNRYASMHGEPNLGNALTWESGVGAAGTTGGMGVKGTADLGALADLAARLKSHPELFTTHEGETVRDMTRRVMNQVQGLGTKTGSLATPWLDLEKANVSAIDLWGIRNTWKRLVTEPDVGEGMVRKMGARLGIENPTPESVLAFADANPRVAEEAAIGIVAAPKQAKYRLASGALNESVPPSLHPNKLAYEPTQFQDFGPEYQAAMRLLDEDRGANPVLEMFPEQWRKWDRYRGRVEPHEFAHPDFRKLPKQSFSEMLAAKQAHSEAGYMAAPKQGKASADLPKQSDWRKLYYGIANPELLTGLGAGAIGALLYGQQK